MGAFEQAYAELHAFVDEHAEIRMTPTSLSVPRGVRPAFYGLVERVQRELAEEVLGEASGCAANVHADSGQEVSAPGHVAHAGAQQSSLVCRRGALGDSAHAGAQVCDEDACDGGVSADPSAGSVAAPRVQAGLADLVEVAAKCAQVRDGLCAQAGLAQFRLASMLESLMADPDAEAVRPLFACVLDALQTGQDARALKTRAREALVPHVELLYRNAYEAWAYYGVVSRLAPRRFYAVFTPDMKEVRAVPTDRVEVARQATSPTLRLPEALFETADGRVFAMKSEAAHELDFYGFKNRRRRDSSSGGSTPDLVTHRVLLLWELASVGVVGFVADRDKSRVVPPALTVEVLEPEDMTTPAYVSAFVERINAVRSRRPVQVIAVGDGEFPAGMLDDPTVAPVQVRHAAPSCRFDTGMLDAIAGVLKSK